MRHLSYQNTCPDCGAHLTTEDIFPNFARTSNSDYNDDDDNNDGISGISIATTWRKWRAK